MCEKCLKNRGDYVIDTLKKEILKLELKPGQAISENEICARFDVSRTPVREALRRLQEQGFVRTVPYSGTYVTLLNLDDIRQMIYMRIAVELMVMKDFMQVATPLLLEEVRHQIRCQELLIQQAKFEPEEFYAMDDQMHMLWFSATGRLKLWTVIQAQQLHYTRFRMLDFVTETDFTRIIREHAGLLDMLEKRDTHDLEEALKKHLSISMTRMYHAIEVEYRNYFEPDSIDFEENRLL